MLLFGFLSLDKGTYLSRRKVESISCLNTVKLPRGRVSRLFKMLVHIHNVHKWNVADGRAQYGKVCSLFEPSVMFEHLPMCQN